eukprot:763153-Hanusia_phi.AAC.3
MNLRCNQKLSFERVALPSMFHVSWHSLDLRRSAQKSSSGIAMTKAHIDRITTNRPTLSTPSAKGSRLTESDEVLWCQGECARWAGAGTDSEETESPAARAYDGVLHAWGDSGCGTTDGTLAYVGRLQEQTESRPAVRWRIPASAAASAAALAGLSASAVVAVVASAVVSAAAAAPSSPASGYPGGAGGDGDGGGGRRGTGG